LIFFLPIFQVTSLNLQRRIPNVVIEELHLQEPQTPPSANRKFCDFLSTHFSVGSFNVAALEAYRGSGYSRGHMAAAGNFQNSSQKGMCEV
jgi:DNA/RNA endonuclease G (NUC1)